MDRYRKLLQDKNSANFYVTIKYHVVPCLYQSNISSSIVQLHNIVWYIRTNLVVTFLVKSRNCRYQEGNGEGVGYSRGRKIKVKEGIKE